MNIFLACLQLFIAFGAAGAVKRGPPAKIDEQLDGDIVVPHSGSAIRGVMYKARHSNSGLKWDRYRTSDGKYVVPYRISKYYRVTEHNNITRAMRMLESNTCILFRKRSSEEDYIDIQSEEGEGCRAPVGRYGGRNVVVLEASKLGTCLELDTVAHELLHVIGLHHEHVRDDRDNYIKVHWENIEKGFESQFSKVVSDQAISHGVEYDYLSIMHYAKDASAKPGTISLETLDSAYQDLIGKQKEPSKGDYMKVCKIYNCKECMGEPMLPQSITPSECRDRLWQCPNFVSKADDCYHYSVVENCCATCSRVNRS